MILLEFAAQGVKGVAPAGGRASLRPGYNVVTADGAALRRLLEALLYPEPRDGETLPRAPGGPGGQAPRAGLTLAGSDRATYRLVRDFGAGAQLHRFDGEKRSFALVSQGLEEIAAFLREKVGVPPREKFSSLLLLSGADLPSRQGAGALAGAASLAPARTGLGPEAARKRITQLEAELGKARISEQVQYQLDGLQARAFKLDEILKGGQRHRDAVEAALARRAELEPVASVAASLGDPAARIATYEKAAAKRDEAAVRAAAERAALEDAHARGSPLPAWRDPLCLAGVLGGAVFALLGLAGGASSPGLRYALLLDVPAFGWSAWRALKWVTAQEAWDRLGRRARVLEDWEQKVEAQFGSDAGDVKAAMAALGAPGLLELKEALARLAEADAAVAAARADLAAWEAGPEATTAAAERAKIDEEQRALEARLGAEADGFVRDVRSVEMEIQRLELEAAAPPPAPVAAPAATPAPRPVAGEPLRLLLERAAAASGGGSASGAGRAVAQKASQVLTGLSFQRLTAVQVDDRGGVHAVTGGRPVAALTLPPADRDLVWLALKLAFLEQALAAGHGCALVEDAFPGLSDGARRFAGRYLKALARPGQVIHATTDAAFREAADHTA